MCVSAENVDLPGMVCPGRVIVLVKQVADALKTVALGLNSWGLTFDILSLPEAKGGMDFHGCSTFCSGTILRFASNMHCTQRTFLR